MSEHEQGPVSGGAGGAPQEPASVRTSPARTWMIKNLIYLPLAIGFGVWSLYDALYLYPKRGIEYAAYQELDYLRSLDRIALASLRYQASVDDPRAALQELKQRRGELAEQSQSAQNRVKDEAERDLARLEWLDALAAVGRLRPEFTTYVVPATDPAAAASPGDEAGVSAEQRLQQLEDTLVEGKEPKKLAFYDIPSQWVFVVVSSLITLNILRLLVTVASTRYRWVPAEQRLYLPSGSSFTPDDLAEPLDKRRWDKFKVSAQLREGHEKSGQPIVFDTYRYAGLEGWLLEMERTAFPEVVEQGSAGQEAFRESPAEEPAGDAPLAPMPVDGAAPESSEHRG